MRQGDVIEKVVFSVDQCGMRYSFVFWRFFVVGAFVFGGFIFASLYQFSDNTSLLR